MLCSIREIASPVVWEGGMLVGKGKGYNIACTVNVMLRQNRKVIIIIMIVIIVIVI